MTPKVYLQGKQSRNKLLMKLHHIKIIHLRNFTQQPQEVIYKFICDKKYLQWTTSFAVASIKPAAFSARHTYRP